ncbi:MAG: phosphoenolpyruvate carboxykinase (GTP), partial [Desulfarculaceae bacterium]|nr:phosphoenolpyruvate carboxykinase (GTP) [Desulfarculaceae bacterium]
MLKYQSGMDIAESIGGVNTKDQALEVLKTVMDEEHYERLISVPSPRVWIKIANAVRICSPDRVYINTGSEKDRSFIRDLAVDRGEENPLAIDGHTVHSDLEEEQGRIVDRTFYVTDPGEHISSLANRKDREDALSETESNMTGIMQGMTMIVGFYMRGPEGAPVSNPAMELTSSAYVAHSAELLYRNAYAGFAAEVERLGYFFTNIHSQGKNRPEDLENARVFMDRNHRTTYSFNCTYAGNTLLLKKGNHRFAVDRAVYEKRGSELAEHMFITGIKGPEGRVTWCAGAAPSGCGKTTTAMAGHLFLGDDLVQMWLDEDGHIRAVNPECGIFGILENVNREGDPILMNALRRPGCEVIWSNVLVDQQDKPHWTGHGETCPDTGINFQGGWEKGMTDSQGKEVPISHPNARCTLSADSLKNYAAGFDGKEGVVTRIFTYSGRDSDTMPPVWVAKNPYHGVAIGACIVSESTATEVGVTGVRRAPWANAPFIPGPLGDYLDAQFAFFGNDRIPEGKKPVMAGLNYFLTHEARGGDSRALLGEKRDVKVWLAWLERYAHKEVEYIAAPIGNLPLYEDLSLLFREILDKEYPQDLYKKQFSLYIDHIVKRIDLQRRAYAEEQG